MSAQVFAYPEYYSYLETSPEYENLAQIFYDIQQPNIHLGQSQKGTFIYNHARNFYMIQESTSSISEHSHIPEVELTSQLAGPSTSHPDMSAARPPVLPWLAEYHDFGGPSSAGIVSGAFSSTGTITPESMYTASSPCSTDETSNVFDMHFGAAIGLVRSVAELEHSSSSTSTSNLTDSFQTSRRSPARTPSPPSETSSQADPRRRFPCLMPGCSRRLTSQYTLKVHIEAHKRSRTKVYFPCTEGCSEQFSRQHDRLRHEVAKHGKVCEFSCDECGRFFSTSKTLGNHKCPLAQPGTRWVHN